jgi:hypothetical protein
MLGVRYLGHQLLCGVAAVDHKVAAGHEGGFIGREIEHAIGDVLGPAEAADRVLAPPFSRGERRSPGCCSPICHSGARPTW